MGSIIIKGSAIDVTVLEKLTPADLFTAGGTDPVYEAISKEVAEFTGNASTDEGRKDIKSMAMKIAKSKTFIDEIGKTFNADLKEKTKAVDAERRVIWNKLEELQHQVRKPVTEWETAEEARVKTHKDAMLEVEILTFFSEPPTVEQIIARIERGVELNKREWDEFREMSVLPLFDAATKLEKMLVATEQADRDRAELETLRQAKADQDARTVEEVRKKAADEERQRIEKEAAEKAQKDAATEIQAEKDKAAKAAADANESIKAMEDKALRDKEESDQRIREAEDAKIAAEAKVKLESEAAVQKERDRAAAEKKRIDDEAKARENNVAHHAKINNEVMAALAALDCVLGEVPAKAITIAIASGKIPHVTISY